MTATATHGMITIAKTSMIGRRFDCDVDLASDGGGLPSLSTGGPEYNVIVKVTMLCGVHRMPFIITGSIIVLLWVNQTPLGSLNYLKEYYTRDFIHYYTGYTMPRHPSKCVVQTPLYQGIITTVWAGHDAKHFIN